LLLSLKFNLHKTFRAQLCLTELSARMAGEGLNEDVLHYNIKGHI